MKKTLLILMLLTTTFFLNGQVTNGLVAKYSFDNGNALDEVGSNNGTVSGAILTTDRFGNAGKAYHFDGINDFINLGNSSTIKPTVGSVSVWAKLTSISNTGSGYNYNPIFLSKNLSNTGSFFEGCGISVRRSDSRVIAITTDFDIINENVNEKFIFSSGSMPVEEWQHYVITYDFDSLSLYVNGVLQNRIFKGFTSTFSTSESVLIGNSGVIGNNRFFNGAIDDIRIYNRVLTQQEVDSLFNLTIAPSAGTLSGNQGICLPGTTTFSSTVSGGTWSSSNTSIATVNASTGVVTGVAAGTATITYTVAGSGGFADATATRTVTVTNPPSAGTLSGNQNVCSGLTRTFSSTVSGGTWSSSNTAIATVNTSTGVVTGVSSGIATITYTIAGGGSCPDATATRTITVTNAPSAGTLSGNQNLCLGAVNTFSSTVSGGTWSSSNTAIATVNASTGVVNGVSAGTATITYTVTGTGGCPNATATRTITVTAPPSAGTLSGNQNICTGSTTTFSTTSSGGSWSSSNTGIATVNASTGLVTGVSAGTATIAYTVTGTGGCGSATAIRSVTVNNAPSAGILSGNQNICTGSTTTFTSTVGLGTWSSSNTAIATVNASTGVVNGVSAGTATITYTVTGGGGCPNATATRTVTVSSTLSAGTLSGNQNICAGLTTMFSSTVSGGSWSSSNTAIATVNASTGVVTGVSGGTATITYTIAGSGGCANATATRTVTVTNPPSAGTLSGNQTLCTTSSLVFSSTVSGGTWSSNNSSVASVNSNSGVVTAGNQGQATIFYTVSGTGGCLSASASIDVTVLESNTTPTFDPIPAICAGENLVLPTTSLNDISGTWSPIENNQTTTVYTFTPSSGQCTSQQTSLTVEVNSVIVPEFTLISEICSGDSYTDLPLTSDNGVEGTWTPALDLSQTTVYTFTPQAGSVCTENYEFTLTVNDLPQGVVASQSNNVLSVGTSFNAYEWYNLNNPSVVLGTQATYTATENGTFAVRVYNFEGCFVESNSLQVVGLSIANILNQTLIDVYPNPVNELLTIENATGLKITILDLAGKKIITIDEALSVEKVDVSMLSNGVYFINLSIGNHSEIVKFVVSK